MNPKDVVKLSPERVRIAKIFKAHIDRAVEELGVGYEVTVQGRFVKRLGKPQYKSLEHSTSE
jgi:hypothetical protein